MKEFPTKILLSQDKDTKEIDDFWVLHDYTDNITKEYVQLDKVIEWIKEHLRFEDDGWHTDTENYKSTIDTVIEDLKKSFILINIDLKKSMDKL